MDFCLGGLMAFLAAARTEVDAAVDYHGGDTDRYLGEAHAITAPLLMHLAGEDEFIGKDAQAEIKTAMAAVPGAVIHSYSGQNHAFARHNAPTMTPRWLSWPTAGLRFSSRAPRPKPPGMIEPTRLPRGLP